MRQPLIGFLLLAALALPSRAVERFVSVDPNVIAEALGPGTEFVAGNERLEPRGVAYNFQKGEQEYRVTAGIYEDEATAQRAVRRAGASAGVGGTLKRAVGDDYLLESYALTVRDKNLCISFKKERVDDVDRLGELAGRVIEAIRASQPLLGRRPSKPRIVVDRAQGLSHRSVVLEYRVEHDAPFLVETRRADSDEVFRVQLERYRFLFGDLTLRAATRDGIVVELPMSEFPAEAWNAGLILKPLPGPSEQEVVAAIERIRFGVTSDRERVRDLSMLATVNHRELGALFDTILASDLNFTEKKFALRGLAKNWAGDGIDRYRELAVDLDQPGIIRRNAIRLIQEFGSVDDIALLQSIANRKDPDTEVAVEYALRKFIGLRESQSRQRRSERSGS